MAKPAAPMAASAGRRANTEKKIKLIDGQRLPQVLAIIEAICAEKAAAGQPQTFSRTEISARVESGDDEGHRIGQVLRRLLDRCQPKAIYISYWEDGIRHFAMGNEKDAPRPAPRQRNYRAEPSAKQLRAEAAARKAELALQEKAARQSLKLAPKIRDSQHPVALWALKPTLTQQHSF